MELAKIVLEYLKVFLSTQVVTVIVLLVFIGLFKKNLANLIDRIHAIKFPGGEVSTPQLEKLKDEKQSITDKTSPTPKSANIAPEENIETIKSLYDAERARAYFWEYSYLNYYLVPQTQVTLDWLATCTSPVSISLYDTMTSPAVSDPSERHAILNALQRHHLIFIENNIITISEKGREYIKWRGNVLQSPPNKT